MRFYFEFDDDEFDEDELLAELLLLSEEDELLLLSELESDEDDDEPDEFRFRRLSLLLGSFSRFSIKDAAVPVEPSSNAGLVISEMFLLSCFVREVR